MKFDEVLRVNADLFDATVPSTQAFGDAAAAGEELIAARRDHKHAMPAFSGAAASVSIADAGDIIAAENVETALQEIAGDIDTQCVAASTSVQGFAPKATAPSAGLRSVLGVDNTETAYTCKALFDATSPSTQAMGDAAVVGTAMTAARRDHKHAMPAAYVEATTSAIGLAPIATAPAAGLRNVLGIDNGATAYTNKALFDATDPSTQAHGDTAVVGTAMTAARRDHKHAMPAAYTHPTGDGNAHVTANSTTNNGKVLTASGVAGTYTWETPSAAGANISLADAGGYFTTDNAEAALQQLAAILLGFKGTSDAVPTSGNCAVNDKYFNDEPASAEYIGWVCTALGTMGTLNGSATTGDILTGTSALTVSDLTGLVVGQYLDVATVTGPLQVSSLPAALGSTTVDVESALGQKVLSVDATTNFVAGETVCIGFAANCEIGVIDSVQAGVSLTLVDSLTATHAIAETVTNCVVLGSAADATADDQAVSFHAATWKGFGLIE
jgi:hypothetical protein